MLIGDGELYRLFFRWRSSEAKLTRRQRIRLLTRLNRACRAGLHFTPARFAARRTVGACLMGPRPTHVSHRTSSAESADGVQHAIPPACEKMMHMSGSRLAIPAKTIPVILVGPERGLLAR